MVAAGRHPRASPTGVSSGAADSEYPPPTGERRTEERPGQDGRRAGTATVLLRCQRARDRDDGRGCARGGPAGVLLRGQRACDRDGGRGFERGGDADEKLAYLHLEAARNAFQHPRRGVLLAAFDLGAVGDGDVSALGDLLEGEAALRALGAGGLPDSPAAGAGPGLGGGWDAGGATAGGTCWRARPRSVRSARRVSPIALRRSPSLLLGVISSVF